MRFVALIFLMTAALSAQAFTDLATTTDGTVLYFTSRLQQRGTDQVAGVGKIFRAMGTSIELAAQPQCDVLPSFPSRECTLQTPDVSGDGKVLTYTFREYDLTSSLNVTRGIIRAQWFDGVEETPVRISRNGAWVLAYTDPYVTLMELNASHATLFAGFSVIGDARQAVADDGTVVLHDSSQNTVLWKAGVASKLNLKHPSGNARMDRFARTIVYEWIDEKYHLNSYDVASGVDRELWSEGVVLQLPKTSVLPLYYHPTITDDGRYVLIQAAYTSQAATKDLWIVATDGSNARQLTSNAGVTSSTVSGNGVIAYAATSDNRILLVNTITSDRFEIVPRTPLLGTSTINPTIAPGDFVSVGGGGLENSTVLVNGEPAWVIAAHNGTVAFRVPWTAPVGQTVPITVANNSPFISNPLLATVKASVPHPWVSQPIHQDFSDFVKPESPAKPGEVVHLYVTGLGIISPLLPLDQPAPLDSLVHAVTPLVCTIDRHGNAPPIDAPVLFAGVAPGQTWIYTVNVMIPAAAANTPSGTLMCGDAPFPISIGTQ